MLEKTGDREKTKQFYEYVHSDEFMSKFGDWINYSQPNTDENGEPLVDSVLKEHVVDDGIADREVYYAPEDNDEDLAPNAGTNEYRFQEVIDQKEKMIGQLSRSYDYALRNEQFLKAEQIGRRIGTMRNEIKILNNKNKRPTSVEEIRDLALRDYRILQRMFDKEEGLVKEELQYAKDTINLWTNMQTNMLFQEELDSNEIMTMVNRIENAFHNFHNDRVRPAYRQNLETEAEKKVGKGALEGIFHDKTNRLAIKDIDWATSEGRNISKTGRLIGDALAIIKQDAHQRARDEFNLEVEKLQKLHQAKEDYKKETGLTDADIFNQVDDQGNETSNNVYRFSQKWFDELSKAGKNYKDYKKFVKNNAITMDPRMLIEDNQVGDESVPDEFLYKSAYTKDMVDQKEQDLKEVLGDEAYRAFLADQKEKLDYYKKRREAKYISLQQREDLTEQQVRTEMNDWVKQHSPYAAMEARDRPASAKDSEGNYLQTFGKTGIYDIPLRYKNGKETGYYDKKFERIQNDSRLYDYYKYFTETVGRYKKYLTPEQRRSMKPNALPFVEKTYLEKMREKGLSAAAADYWSMYQDGIKSGKSFKADESNRQLSAPIVNKEKMIKDIQDNKINDARSKGNEVNAEDRKQFRKEAEQEVANMQQNDRTNVLSAYLASLVSFKYASRIQTTMEIADNVVRDGMEIKAQGGVKIGDFNEDPEMTENGLDRMKKSMSFFVNNFYGISDTPWGVKETKRKVNPETGVVEDMPTKSYNHNERKKLNELEEQEKEIQDELDQLQKQMENGEANPIEGQERKKALEVSLKDIEKKKNQLGDHFAWSGVGQKGLQYLQLKTMGYNFFSAFATLGFGVINNYTEAADGRSFNEKELTEAYSMVMNSVLKNSTLNAIETETAKKIRNMMDTYNFSATETTQIGQDGADISRQREKGWKGLLKRFLPYKSQQHAEYLAQAPIMIARMKRIKVNDADGNERTLWDAHDSNGDWNTELMGENTYYAGDPNNPDHNVGRAAVKTNIDELIEKNHGDYSGELPTKFTEDVFKGAVMQFRKWIVESYSSRMQKRKYFSRLGYEVKGRFQTGILGLSWTNDTEYSKLDQNMFAIKQLLRKVTFQGTRFNEVFDEVDAANLRANLNELVMLLGLFGVGLMLNYGFDDDDDSGVLNYMLNWLNRVESDILMYMNPFRTIDILKNPVAGFSILEDAGSFAEATYNLMRGEDEIEGGQYDGDSKFMRESLNFVPLLNEIPKLDDLTRLQRQAQ
jgi:hypothetical protein